MVHDGIGDLHAHADVHLVVGKRKAQAFALILQPLRAAAARSNDDVLSEKVAFFRAGTVMHAGCAPILQDHMLCRGAAHESEGFMLHQPFIHVFEHDG